MATGDDPLERLAAAGDEPAGARVDFQAQLGACDAALVGLMRTLADAVVPVTTAFLEGDEHLAGQAATVDEDVERDATALEEACYALLARQSPVGGDLRRVVGILRSVAGVQRAASLLRHVATSLEWVHPPSMPHEVRQIVAQLGDICAEILYRAAEAWETHDGLAAVELESRDDQADLLQKCLLTEIYTGRQSVEEAVSLALLARYYERIADHGVEAARQIAYVVTGDRVPQA